MNGRSYMEFSTDLTAVTIKDGASIGSKTLGSWKAGLSSPLLLTDPDNMSDYSAQLVYRIVTVEVGERTSQCLNSFDNMFIYSCVNNWMTFCHKMYHCFLNYIYIYYNYIL